MGCRKTANPYYGDRDDGKRNRLAGLWITPGACKDDGLLWMKMVVFESVIGQPHVIALLLSFSLVQLRSFLILSWFSDARFHVLPFHAL